MRSPVRRLQRTHVPALSATVNAKKAFMGPEAALTASFQATGLRTSMRLPASCCSDCRGEGATTNPNTTTDTRTTPQQRGHPAHFRCCSAICTCSLRGLLKAFLCDSASFLDKPEENSQTFRLTTLRTPTGAPHAPAGSIAPLPARVKQFRNTDRLPNRTFQTPTGYITEREHLPNRGAPVTRPRLPWASAR